MQRLTHTAYARLIRIYRPRSPGFREKVSNYRRPCFGDFIHWGEKLMILRLGCLALILSVGLMPALTQKAASERQLEDQAVELLLRALQQIPRATP